MRIEFPNSILGKIQGLKKNLYALNNGARNVN